MGEHPNLTQLHLADNNYFSAIANSEMIAQMLRKNRVAAAHLDLSKQRQWVYRYSLLQVQEAPAALWVTRFRVD
jgi:hypothetical protein